MGKGVERGENENEREKCSLYVGNRKTLLLLFFTHKGCTFFVSALAPHHSYCGKTQLTLNVGRKA